MEVITFLGYLLLRRSVLLLVILGGIVFAIIRWKRHPRVSLITLLALVLYLVESSAFAFVFHYLPRFFNTLKLSDNNISVLDSVLSLVDDFGFAAVLILLVAAAFTGRVGENATPPHANSGHAVPSSDIGSENPVVYGDSPLETRSWSLATQLGIPGLNKIIIIAGVIILGILILIIGVALMLISPTLLWQETVPGAGPFGFPLIRTTDYRVGTWLCGVALLIVGGITSALGVIAAFLVGYKAGMFDTSEKDKELYPANTSHQIVAGEPRLRFLHQVLYSLRLSQLARPPEFQTLGVGGFIVPQPSN